MNETAGTGMRVVCSEAGVEVRLPSALVHLLCEEREEQHEDSENEGDPESPRCKNSKVSRDGGQAVLQDVHMPPRLSGTVTTRMVLSALPETKRLDAVLNRRVVGGKSCAFSIVTRGYESRHALAYTYRSDDYEPTANVFASRMPTV